MKEEYIKPEIIEEKIELEDIIAASSGKVSVSDSTEGGVEILSPFDRIWK